MKTSHFPICSQRKRTSTSVVLHQLLRELRRTVIAHCHKAPAKKRRVFDFKDLCDPEDDQQQNRNELVEYANEWEWEREDMRITSGNGIKTRLNLGMGMGMKHWNGRELD